MFSLKETADGKFIYRCHGCDSETELMALDQMMAADQAVAYSMSCHFNGRYSDGRMPVVRATAKTDP